MLVAGGARNLNQGNASPLEQPASAEDLLQSKKRAELPSGELLEMPAESERAHPESSGQLADVRRTTSDKTAHQVARDLGLDVACESHQRKILPDFFRDVWKCFGLCQRAACALAVKRYSSSFRAH